MSSRAWQRREPDSPRARPNHGRACAGHGSRPDTSCCGCAKAAWALGACGWTGGC